MNLAQRAFREARDAPVQPQPRKRKATNFRKTVKIGRPGYRVTKQFNTETKQRSLLFQIEYPEIEDGIKPRHRFMSSSEQSIEPYDRRYQYLAFAADPYEIISFKVPSIEIDNSTSKFFSHWDPDSKMFTLQIYFKTKPPPANGTAASPPPPPPPMMGALPVPPPPPPVSGGGIMANFTPGTQMSSLSLSQGFSAGQQMQSMAIRPPPPPPNMGQQIPRPSIHT